MKNAFERRLLAVIAAAGVVACSLVAATPMATADPYATSPDGQPIALTPPMGWNNWAYFGCDPNSPNAGDTGPSEALLVQQGRAMVESGLADVGYDTITIDDCWMTGSRDAEGNLQSNPAKFPNGIKAVADTLHAMGLKFGIYLDVGTRTCGGYPGSFGHFTQDANLIASWGVDYVKFDGCNMPADQADISNSVQQYAAFGQALKSNTSKRPMVYAPETPLYHWIDRTELTDYYTAIDAASAIGQLWRTGYDVKMRGIAGSAWDRNQNNAGILTQYDYNKTLARYSGPGSFNDPDFLIPGVGLSDDESRTQIALWSMMASPLIISADLTTLSQANLAALTNKDVVAINQDPLAKQAGIVAQDGTTDLLSRPLSNGDIAVAMLNRGGGAVTASTSLADLGFASGCTASAKDLWSGQTTAVSGTLSATIASHATAIFRITPGAGCGDQVPTGQFTGLAGKCLDVHDSGTADGTAVELFGCHGGANQRWSMQPDGTIRSLGRCLDVSEASDGLFSANIRACNGSPTQQWTYERNGNVRNVGQGACLDVANDNAADAARVIVWTCGGRVPNQSNQLWSVPVA